MTDSSSAGITSSPDEHKNTEPTTETAFELLQQGKQHKSGGNAWKAASLFLQATSMLKDLALNQHQEPAMDEEERTKIQELYFDKSKHYFHESRQCLVEAMKQELERDEEEFTKSSADTVDESNKGKTYRCSTLSMEEATMRNQTFQSLFSKCTVDQKTKSVETNSEPEKAKDDQVEDVANQQLSLEERLMNLNRSLPKELKTDDERMNDLNRSLNKFGLSLYDQKKPFARLQDELPKSEEEQVASIMQQAEDEVAFERLITHDQTNISGTPTKQDNTKEGGRMKAFANGGDIDGDYDSEDDDDDSEDEKSDMEILDDEQLAIKKIRQRIVQAQVKLAELVALLDEAQSAKKQEEEEKDLIDGSDDNSLDGKRDPMDAKEFLQEGSRKLTSARKALQKAQMRWAESLT